MATWVIIAALATIGVTAILMGALYRLNAVASARQDRSSAAGGGNADGSARDGEADSGGS
jgi:hypothetical protein